MDILRKMAMEKAVNDAEEQEPLFASLCRVAAKNNFIYFEELKSKGFNAHEALQIVIFHGMNPNIKP